MNKTIKQTVESVDIMMLYVDKHNREEVFVSTVKQAIEYIQEAPEIVEGELVQTEAKLILDDNTKIEGTFFSKEKAIAFIKGRLDFKRED